MLADPTGLPPERDLPPGQLEARQDHLLAEIGSSEKVHDSRWRRPRWALRVGLVGLALCVTIVAGVVFALRTDRGAEVVTVAPDDGGASGAPAPKVEGPDVLTGASVSLADFKGKPVAINVWASWCPGCREEGKDLYEFAKAHPELQMLGIDIQDTIPAGKAFHEEFHWFWPSVFDPDGAISARFGLLGLPETFFLNADHEIVARIPGAGDLRRFEQGLELALAE